MSGSQIFVTARNQRDVVEAIRAHVAQAGAAVSMTFRAGQRSDPMAQRERRTFIVSTPSARRIAVWEDGCWGDRHLARALSASLTAQTMWLLVSPATDRWGYITYEGGRQVDRHAESTPDASRRAETFVRDNELPFGLVFFQEPGFEDQYEQFLARMKATAPAGSPFHQIDARRRARPGHERRLARFPDGAKVPPGLRARVARFAELTLPVPAEAPTAGA